MPNDYNKEKDPQNLNKEQFTNYAKSVVKEGENRVKDIADDFQKQIKQGQEQLGKIAATADKQVRANPWPVLAGVAVVSFLLGSCMSSRRN